MYSIKKLFTKAIEEIPPLAKAALVLRHLAAGDQRAADEVLDSVPLKHYAMPDQETMRPLKIMGFAILFWTSEQNRLMAGLFACLWGSTMELHRGGMSLADRLRRVDKQIDPLMFIQGRLLALDKALKSFCAKNSLDISVVSQLTGATPFAQMPEQCLALIADENGLDAEELRKTVDMEAFSILMPEVTVDEPYLIQIERMMGALP
jgi:hypothetical protein